MKERPILFTPDNAQKIFEGKKTQTRRIVKNPDYYSCLTGDCPHDSQDECHKFMVALCPYGLVGDRLTIREAHYLFGQWQPFGNTKTGQLKYRFTCDVVELTEVHVERLHQITKEDALKEGCEGPDHKRIFMALWQSIHGVESWNQNPFVWVLSFRKVETIGLAP